MKKLTIFGKEIIDDNSVQQIQRCLGENDIGVLTADAHFGYGHPIGGAVAYKDKISLSGIGFDIGCGNKAVLTNLQARDIDTSKIMDEIVAKISFGIGRNNPIPVDHPVLDKIAKADFTPQRKFYPLACSQLGTIGAGNHYIDLFEDELGRLWIGVHFGSRGFGHRTTMGFIALSQGKNFEDKVHEGSMESPPVLFDLHSELANDYIEAVQLAGEYAYAGRDLAVEKVLKILGANVIESIHNHHNFAWKENHFGEEYWVVRKGCTPAFPAQKSFIGATMGDISVIVEGVDSDQSKDGLYSTVHGAGRIMSRTKAAGKKRWRRGKGNNRNRVVISQGLINFEEVRQNIRSLGIELRGGGADEAPACYKKLEQVLEYHKGTIRILHHLKPIGVAMAGEDVFDPYKD